MRCVTRRVYVSSSFVPNRTSRTTVAAAMTMAASSARKNESTANVWSERSAASCRIQASSRRTRTNPSASMYGSRSEARSGGSRAFSRAMRAAARKAPPRPSIDTPGTTRAATHTARAAVTQPTTTRRRRRRGRAGLQAGAAPYSCASSLSVDLPWRTYRTAALYRQLPASAHGAAAAPGLRAQQRGPGARQPQADEASTHARVASTWLKVKRWTPSMPSPGRSARAATAAASGVGS